MFKTGCPIPYDKDVVVFQNGFSTAWNICKKNGDIVWISHEEKLPIEKGTVYVSCWFKKDARQAAKWAKENPNLNIIVGGPVVTYYNLNVGTELTNFKYINRKNVEEVFKVSDKELMWNLEYINENKDIWYTFALEKYHGCYWNKCRYCKIVDDESYRNFKEIPIINHSGHKNIWLHTYSISPNTIKELFHKFPKRNDVSYMTYMRADNAILKALKESFYKMVAPTKNLLFSLGIEIPSNRMLKLLRKGSTIKQYLNVIKLLCDYGCEIHFNLMTDWDNLTKNDVDNVNYFLTELSKIEGAKNIMADLYPIQVVYDRPFAKDFKNLIKEENSNWDLDIYHPLLDDKQIKLNDQIRKLYHNFNFSKFIDFTGRKLF
jgi:hypothetical protein